MTKYTENLSVSFTEEQYERIDKAVAEGGYSGKSEYIRSMVEAGESNIAALDPRTSDSDTSLQTSHNNAKQAARSLSDAAIIDQLSAGESNKKNYDEVTGSLIEEFEGIIIDRLKELAEEPSSPVQNDGMGNYWVSQ